ncbi:hypothetical protein FJK70_02030, partial [Escherichia coli]|nr:hypothetical protein [Escherichia coli]
MKIIIISLWLQIKHIIFLCVPFLRKPYFMRIISRQQSINQRASQCGSYSFHEYLRINYMGNDSNLLFVFYVQI